MIAFFRKIRKKLLSKKKVSRYLAYATGEILLVVIGILIALGINNSNQRRINRNIEQIYLAGLEGEFETSKSKLLELIKINHQNIEGAKSILSFPADQTDLLNEQKFSELLYQSFSSDIAFNPNNSLLEEMINSGNLKIISNTELRRLLMNWNATIEDIARQENELSIQRENVLDQFRTEENSLRTIFDQVGVSEELTIPKGENRFSNLELLNSTKFENNVLMFILTSHATEKAHYNPLLQNIEKILDTIRMEED